jgi:DNA-binding HxlR family transcriptional regulator
VPVIVTSPFSDMRSYGQYCGLARALDVVGERWTLLIVRELLLGPRRYTDLHKGLPGIATNLLATRLADLETAGLVTREEAPPPIATTLYRLTPRGEDLRPVIAALGRWAQPLLAQGVKGDAFRAEWLALPAQLYLADRKPGRAPTIVEVRTGDQSVVVEARDGAIQTRLGRADDPDAVITARPDVAMALLLGRIDLPTARARGLKLEGDARALERFEPV